MATRNSRDVRVGLAIDVDGTEDVSALGKELRDLGTDGKALPAAFNETAAALDKLTAKTRELREAEGTARADRNADKTALREKVDALARLRAESDKATRSTAEFQASERALKLAVIDGKAALRDKVDALAQASTAARSAASAESTLRAELTAATNAYRQTGAAAKAAADQQVTAGDATRKALADIGDQLRAIQTLAAAAVGGQLLGGLVGSLAQTTDAFSNLQARIRLATGEGAAFELSALVPLTIND